MDQLVQHCMRELSYDGDFGKCCFRHMGYPPRLANRHGFEPSCAHIGCSASRLSTFIQRFYDSSPSLSRQLVDDAFVSYVWKLVVRQPGIRVGLLPLGVPAVWVAPQGHRGIKGVEEDENDASRNLHPIHENIFTTPLHQLKGRYGDQLHIASNPKTTFAVITGSHSRVSTAAIRGFIEQNIPLTPIRHFHST
jgi:oxalate---CoA ligase